MLARRRGSGGREKALDAPGKTRVASRGGPSLRAREQGEPKGHLLITFCLDGRRCRLAGLATLVLATALGLTACAGSTQVAGESATGRVVVAIVDQSCDASEQLTASAEAAITRSVHAAASGEGTFIAQSVTTIAYPSLDFAETKDFVTTKKNGPGRERDLAYQAEEYLKEPAVRSLTAGHTDQGCGSDLIDALKAVHRAVTTQTRFVARPLDIVYVTNGIVVNDLANFRRADLSSAGIAKLLGRVKEQGFLPDLAGARVHFVGLGLDPNLDGVRASQIEQFWARLAREANAEPVIVPAGSQLDLSGREERP